MNFSFLNIDFIDVIDVLLVSFILYQFYRLVKGNLSINLFLLLVFFYISWYLTRIFNLQLLHTLLSEIYKIGGLIFLILFQPEIRRWILNLGRSTNISIKDLLQREDTTEVANQKIKDAIVNACSIFSSEFTGALIVLADAEERDFFNNSGVLIDAEISAQLLKNIFFKNTPLHDGAVVISEGKIYKAGVILPVSENRSIEANVGLRHRAAIGITEELDVKVIIVSEETGKISYAKEGVIAPMTRKSLNQVLDVVLVSKDMMENYEE